MKGQCLWTIGEEVLGGVTSKKSRTARQTPGKYGIIYVQVRQDEKTEETNQAKNNKRIKKNRKTRVRFRDLRRVG